MLKIGDNKSPQNRTFAFTLLIVCKHAIFKLFP